MSDATLRALVLLAEGAEEMEAVICVDVLRRAGIEVVLAGLDGAAPVQCSRGVVIVPDAALGDVKDQPFDVVVLPGGVGGADRLAASTEVGALLRERESRGAYVAAVCAAPAVLATHGVFAGRAMTSHPSVAEKLAEHARRNDDPVVHDGSLITSQGPGTSLLFALSIVDALCGHEKAQSVRSPMQIPS